jgi:hypothetical protein
MMVVGIPVSDGPCIVATPFAKSPHDPTKIASRPAGTERIVQSQDVGLPVAVAEK